MFVVLIDCNFKYCFIFLSRCGEGFIFLDVWGFGVCVFWWDFIYCFFDYCIVSFIY